MFFETSQKWEKLNKRLEEYDKLFGEQERKEQQELKEWSKKFRQKNWISFLSRPPKSIRLLFLGGHSEGALKFGGKA